MGPSLPREYFREGRWYEKQAVKLIDEYHKGNGEANFKVGDVLPADLPCVVVFFFAPIA